MCETIFFNKRQMGESLFLPNGYGPHPCGQEASPLKLRASPFRHNHSEKGRLPHSPPPPSISLHLSSAPSGATKPRRAHVFSCTEGFLRMCAPAQQLAGSLPRVLFDSGLFQVLCQGSSYFKCQGYFNLHVSTQRA